MTPSHRMSKEPSSSLGKAHTQHLLPKKNRQHRDVACSVSVQYKIPPKVLEIKYSPSHILSLHFSIIRNNSAIMMVKGIFMLFEIEYTSINVLRNSFNNDNIKLNNLRHSPYSIRLLIWK